MKNPFLFSFLFGIACCLLPLKFTLAATYFFDNFDTASTIDLASKTPGTGTGYTRVINNGQTIYAPSYFDFAAVTASIDNAGALYSANATYTSADYELTAVISFAGGDYNYSRSFALRMQDANNMYLLRITYGSQGFQIYKRVSGTWTLLGSASVSVAGNTNAPYKGDTIKFRVEGNQLTAYQNGTLKLTVTDSEISTAGQAGLGLGYVNISTDDSGTGMGIDDFTVRSLDDDIPPALSSTFPSDNGTSVTTTANLIMNFDEAVGAKTGNITIYKASDDSIFEQIDVTSGNVSGSGTTMITVNPTGTFNESTSYYVTIDTTAFDDLVGNSYAGITSSSTWNFTTGDFTNPALSSTFPSDNGTSVTTTANLVMTFNEPVYTKTGNVSIYKDDDSLFEQISIISANVTGSSTSKITINPTGTFDEQTSYYVIVDATAIDDASSNSFSGITSSSTWNFTTGDFTNPALSSTFPSDNGTSVTTTANLIMNFDEAVGAKTGNITIYKASDDSIFEQIDVTSGNVSGSGTTMITVNPTSSLNYETDYYVTVDATSFDDASGNSYTGISSSSTWNFTTEDTPTCSTVSHALTYNAYPSCGPATCESGYAVSGGLCVATGGGSTSTPSPSIGTGDSSQSIPMNTRMNIGSILTSGTNILGYIHSSALFTAQESRTQKKSGSYR